MSVREKIIETIEGFDWSRVRSLPADPDWVSDLADKICSAIDDQPFHTIELREDGWTLKHPLDCRDDLFGCPYNAASRDLAGPPRSGPGIYRVDGVDIRGQLIIGERVVQEVSGG